MIRRFAFLLVALITCSALFTGCASAPPAKEKVVLHLTDKDPYRWNIIYNNSKKMMEFLGPEKVEIEVVANGGGIQMLTAESAAANRVDELVKMGIKVVACQETMLEAKMTAADMNPNIGYVPRGNLELVRLHHEGWTYIRP